MTADAIPILDCQTGGAVHARIIPWTPRGLFGVEIEWPGDTTECYFVGLHDDAVAEARRLDRKN
jgi:hypothetical protein